ncbi:hypothetical protein TanjilG_01901 [Lupinus angustifolius]|uniref:Uncharacterized protein n=1 Tax=Lupinus angustifolius TaxID=3871 RepID=A0A394D9E0_LUPAN|nr:hypothetical protein TanjilG_01901 [Lupinus angustifolius]
MADLVNLNGELNISLLNRVVSKDILDKILALHPPSVAGPDDSVAWVGSKDGIFSVNSAYSIIVG